MLVEDNKPRRRTSTTVVSLEGDHTDATTAQPSMTTAKSKPTQEQRCSKFSIILFVASLILFSIYASHGRWRDPQSNVSDFLDHLADDAVDDDSLGIILHPEEHRSRDSVIITLHWTITSDFRAPDGVKKRVYLINGNCSVSYLLPSSFLN
jgi:hypothetical protein